MEFITFLHSAQVYEQVFSGGDEDRSVTLTMPLPTSRRLVAAALSVALTLPAIAPAAYAQDVPEIAILQELLVSRGFDPGPVDGIKGEATTAAILQAQAFYGLEQDGIVGTETLAALQRDDYRAEEVAEPEASEASDEVAVADVAALQELLSLRGFYDGAVDGIHGPMTAAAILQAQAFYGLEQDGIVGPMTLAALQEDSYEVATSNDDDGAPAAVSDVTETQRLLASRGFYRATIDGIKGPETERAILQAQAFYGLTADGVFGPETLAALEADTFFVAPNS
jgi:peptidoglycan hydrolase-like protein with peptidoglycan-binding domain